MEKETFFWASMESFSARGKKRQTPITHAQLEMIHETLLELRGVWEAGNFVKICTHLETCSLENVAQSLIHLRKHNFDYENTVNAEKGGGYRINEGTPDMRLFLSSHFIELTNNQKIYLSDLRPGYMPRQALHVS